MTTDIPVATVSPAQPLRLLDQFRNAARVGGQPEPWIEPLTSWITAFIIFHGKRHPSEQDAADDHEGDRRAGQEERAPLRQGIAGGAHPRPEDAGGCGALMARACCTRRRITR